MFEGIDPPAVTGQFHDSPVQGLAYETATQSGITDEGGNFKFKRREEIAFAIGGIFLGRVTDKFTVTPFDLVPGAIDDSDAAVLHICRFLQSLDVDGNPANGINITPETAELLQGFNLAIGDITEAMMQDILDTLNGAGVFSANTPRQLVSAAAAHSHFLQFLATVDRDNDRFNDAIDCNDIDPDINPGADEICEDGVDQDCDGSDLVCPPATTSTTTTTSSTTTVLGETTTSTTITTSTTATTSSTITTLPPAANWVLTEILIDEDNDGAMDEHRYYYYDDNRARKNDLYDLGMQVAARWDWEERDWFADGSIDLVRDHYYTYDNNERLTIIMKDEHGNGTIDEVNFYTYAGNGDLATEGLDRGNDGIIDERSYFTFGSNGRLATSAEDRDNDGAIDAITFLNVDGDGNWVSLEVDEDNNGLIDAVMYITIDSNGNWESRETDEGNNGTIDAVEYYFWSNAAANAGALAGGRLSNPGSLADAGEQPVQTISQSP